jgi:hypothetical protein
MTTLSDFAARDHGSRGGAVGGHANADKQAQTDTDGKYYPDVARQLRQLGKQTPGCRPATRVLAWSTAWPACLLSESLGHERKIACTSG